MELWNEFCFLVNQHRRPNSTERDFQIEAEHLFEKLGWSRYKSEIITQQTIPIGSAQNLKPDIIITQGSKRILVVELKKPNAEIVARNSNQIVSYMLQLRLRFGLLLGDSIQVYFDVPDDNENPLKVIEIPFTPDNADGEELIGLLTKDTYSDELFTSWCKAQITKKIKSDKTREIIEKLTSQTGQLLFCDVLRSRLCKEYPEDVVSQALKSVSIQVIKNEDKVQSKNLLHVYQRKQTQNEEMINTANGNSVSRKALRIDLDPEPETVFKKLLLIKKSAKIYIYYGDGRVDERHWDASKFSESSSVMGNLRSRPEFRNGEWQRRGIDKVLCKVE